ncbi:mitochondrial ribosome-associated GTPase 1-like [Nothobranchius furzeri]|uniref:mitochondrial ribosome-associated GTPase 1-like n=1 Tax=Nothobranchius furzeri TaxID=105023 RepID=UPI003904D88B
MEDAGLQTKAGGSLTVQKKCNHVRSVPKAWDRREQSINLPIVAEKDLVFAVNVWIFASSLQGSTLSQTGHGRASRVGGERGITRAVLTKIQVCERPLIYLLDTPGVLPPKIESVETGMKLALCGTILDHLVGEDIIAEYLLYSLNRLGNFSYAEKYDLPEPSDDIQYVLKRIAVKLQKTQKVKALTGVGNITVTIPNYTAAANDFIRAFRKGELGPVMLD